MTTAQAFFHVNDTRITVTVREPRQPTMLCHERALVPKATMANIPAWLCPVLSARLKGRPRSGIRAGPLESDSLHPCQIA